MRGVQRRAESRKRAGASGERKRGQRDARRTEGARDSRESFYTRFPDQNSTSRTVAGQIRMHRSTGDAGERGEFRPDRYRDAHQNGGTGTYAPKHDDHHRRTYARTYREGTRASSPPLAQRQARGAGGGGGWYLRSIRYAIVQSFLTDRQETLARETRPIPRWWAAATVRSLPWRWRRPPAVTTRRRSRSPGPSIRKTHRRTRRTTPRRTTPRTRKWS